MKHKYLIVSVFMLLFLSFIVERAHAGSLQIGGAVWCAGWDYYKKNFYQNHIYPHSTVYSTYHMNWAVLYGPALTVFYDNKLSFSNTFMCTDQYRMRASYVDIYMVGLNKRRVSFFKYEIDSTINYAINPYLKIFAGFKFQAYSNEGKYKYYSEAVLQQVHVINKSNAPGLGVGIGTTVPLYNQLYLLASVSAVYLRLYGDSRYQLYRYIESSGEIMPGIGRIKELQDAYGSSMVLSLAYYIEKANLTISLGGRYQVLYHKFVMFEVLSYNSFASIENNLIGIYRTKKEGLNSVNDTYDHFYGATFSIMYSIDFGKNKGQPCE